MKVKDGYNGKEIRINISARKEERKAEIWLVQTGLELPAEYEQYKDTLSYITLEELLDLRDEVAKAIKEITS